MALAYNTERHRELGVHCIETDGTFRYVFRTDLPSADSVHLVGDFAGWEKGRPMTALADGIWEYIFTTQHPLDGQKYKFKLTQGGKTTYRPDPYATAAEAFGWQASIVRTRASFFWSDSPWLKQRSKKNTPLHLYEVDLSCWRTNEGKAVGTYGAELSYRQLADSLVPYLKGLGYTHIALLPSANAPNLPFAPSPVFGSPEDFKYFVNKFHTNGMGVIASHTLPDTASILPQKEAVELMLSSASYFVREFHLDGLLAEESALSEENRKDYLNALSTVIHSEAGVLLLTEKSSPDADLVIDRAGEQALSAYFSCDPFFRHYHHDKLSYFASGRIFPESQGKDTSRMTAFFGNYEDKFKNNRLYAAYRAFVGGRLSSFMGNEFAPFSPFDSTRQLEWFMTDFDMHRRHRDFVQKINHFYLTHPLLWKDADGNVTQLFSDSERNLLALARQDTNDTLIALFNFSAIEAELSLSLDGAAYFEVFATDSEAFGGGRNMRRAPVTARDGLFCFDIPPLSAVIVQPAASAADCHK